MATLFFDDPDLDGQFGRTLYATVAGSADLGEAFATARRITPGDLGSWYREWTATGDSVAAEAAASAAGGHRVSARQAYLRAAEYHRQAFFYCRDDLAAAALHESYGRHRDAFRSAVALMDGEARAVAIPYGSATLNGYLYRPADDDVARPTVVLPAGYDSTAESGWVDGAAMALEHGMNALTFEGPGQGGVLYEQGLTFRHDFEAVLTPVLDWLLEQDGVDPEALVLFGRSFAGYLAPRGATAEHRLAALVCDPAQYDFGESMRARVGDDVWAKVLAADPAVDAQLNAALDDPSTRNWYLLRMVTHGTTTVGDYFRELARFSLRGLADRITCPTLLLDAEGDPSGSGQSAEIARDLGGPATVHHFTDAEGAGGHCEGLGQRRLERVAFDWIESVLAARPVGVAQA